MLVFNKYFYKNKKSKLYFGDRVAVLNDFIYQTGGSITFAGVGGHDAGGAGAVRRALTRSSRRSAPRPRAPPARSCRGLGVAVEKWKIWGRKESMTWHGGTHEL
jgi:hypothetical protein